MGVTYSSKNDVTLKTQDCLKFLASIRTNSAQLVITSPPYNVGKEYETNLTLAEYEAFQKQVIDECVRIVRPGGSICWQVGTFMRGSNWIRPLDLVIDPLFEAVPQSAKLRLRNRIVWHFEHGMHCESRFSGRHEVILWYTKGDEYKFNLDEVRVPQKYPGKTHHKGPRRGQYSGNPKGKNPGDSWLNIPNVKANHVEKEREHPCQFPVEVPRRLILALSDRNDLIVDPFMGVGTTAVAAIITGRRVAGCDIVGRYTAIARRRIRKAWSGELRIRRDKPVFVPSGSSRLLQIPEHFEIAARGA